MGAGASQGEVHEKDPTKGILMSDILTSMSLKIKKRKIMTNHRIRLIKIISCIFIFFSCLPSFAQNIPNKDRLLQENAAKKLLNQALISQKKGELNKAIKDLIIITDYYSDYSQIDVVFSELGSILTEMELYSAASRIYKHIISNYRVSSKVPYALFGLQKINYLQERYRQSLELYNQLEKEFASSEVGGGKHYYAGQSFLAMDDFDSAINAFNKIEDNSEFKSYGLYSRAVAKLKKKIFLKLLMT